MAATLEPSAPLLEQRANRLAQLNYAMVRREPPGTFENRDVAARARGDVHRRLRKQGWRRGPPDVADL